MARTKRSERHPFAQPLLRRFLRQAHLLVPAQPGECGVDDLGRSCEAECPVRNSVDEADTVDFGVEAVIPVDVVVPVVCGRAGRGCVVFVCGCMRVCVGVGGGGGRGLLGGCVFVYVGGCMCWYVGGWGRWAGGRVGLCVGGTGTMYGR
jgi:hypothetical protein